jgi:hypothetical protein
MAVILADCFVDVLGQFQAHSTKVPQIVGNNFAFSEEVHYLFTLVDHPKAYCCILGVY